MLDGPQIHWIFSKRRLICDRQTVADYWWLPSTLLTLHSWNTCYSGGCFKRWSYPVCICLGCYLRVWRKQLTIPFLILDKIEVQVLSSECNNLDAHAGPNNKVFNNPHLVNNSACFVVSTAFVQRYNSYKKNIVRYMCCSNFGIFKQRVQTEYSTDICLYSLWVNVQNSRQGTTSKKTVKTRWQSK